MHIAKYLIAFSFCLAALTGCGKTVAESVPDSKYLLAVEPADAVDVLDIRAEAKDGQPVVVLGRIDAGVKPWIEGRAAFVIVDDRVQATCNDEKCTKDGCAHCAKELQEASAIVKFVDEQGKILPVDARQLLGVKERQIVVVRGVANRDLNGNVSIAADGFFVRR